MKSSRKSFYLIYVKRALDIVFVCLAGIILLPVMGIIVLLIKLDDGQSVIFSQERLGRAGIPFVIYKFRSMSIGSENAGVYSDKSDVRVTGIGRILRATSLDELPQLWNILRGDMSLIGPRPPLTFHPWPIENYTTEQFRMFEIRPGLTGLAQVNGRKELMWDQRIEMNLWYIDHLSFLFDLKIFAKTVMRVIKRTGNANSGATVASPQHVERSEQA